MRSLGPNTQIIYKSITLVVSVRPSGIREERRSRVLPLAAAHVTSKDLSRRARVAQRLRIQQRTHHNHATRPASPTPGGFICLLELQTGSRPARHLPPRPPIPPLRILRFPVLPRPHPQQALEHREAAWRRRPIYRRVATCA